MSLTSSRESIIFKMREGCWEELRCSSFYPRFFSRVYPSPEIVQATKELIRPKGQIMAEYQAGLHKEVTSIFQGVWDPKVDNTEKSYTPTGTNRVVYHMGPPPARNKYREPKFATVVRALSEVPHHIFSLKSRREKKRLMSISKHLIINNSTS